MDKLVGIVIVVTVLAIWLLPVYGLSASGVRSQGQVRHKPFTHLAPSV